MRSIALLFVLWASAHADSLVLRNGTRVTGRWWAADADVINFLVDGRRLERYPRAEVTEVVFGDETVANPAPAAAAPPSAPAVAAAPAAAARSTGTAAALREPEEIGVVYFEDAGGHLAPLERIAAAGHRGTTGFGGRPSQYWDMPGARSSFRLRTDSRLVFVVEMPGGVGPGAFQLYPLETKGNTRRTKTGNGGLLTVPLSIRRVSGDTYTLTPATALGPGEYSFSPSNSNDGYCFGID